MLNIFNICMYVEVCTNMYVTCTCMRTSGTEHHVLILFNEKGVKNRNPFFPAPTTKGHSFKNENGVLRIFFSLFIDQASSQELGKIKHDNYMNFQTFDCTKYFSCLAHVSSRERLLVSD